MQQIMQEIQEKKSIQLINATGCGCNINQDTNKDTNNDINENTNVIRYFPTINGVKASSAQPYIKVDKLPKNLIEEILATKKRGLG